VKPAIAELAENRLNLLLPAGPVSWVLAWVAPESAWVFITAALSLVPLAGIIGLGTDELACRAGRRWAAF
jgi:hypothetical protein